MQVAQSLNTNNIMLSQRTTEFAHFAGGVGWAVSTRFVQNLFISVQVDFGPAYDTSWDVVWCHWSLWLRVGAVGKWRWCHTFLSLSIPGFHARWYIVFSWFSLDWSQLEWCDISEMPCILLNVLSVLYCETSVAMKATLWQLEVMMIDDRSNKSCFGSHGRATKAAVLHNRRRAHQAEGSLQYMLMISYDRKVWKSSRLCILCRSMAFALAPSTPCLL